MKYIVLLLLFSFSTYAQLQKNIELEVLGRPTWDMQVSLGEKGMIFIVKSDITKINIFRLDSDLRKVWEKEYFLDAEKAPKAYTIASDHISFLFSETQGMYYQVFEIDLTTGTLNQSGFELREYFVDQDYVFLGDKVIMAGSNEKGAAFFEYDFKNKIGELIEKDIKGQIEVNQFEYLPATNQIESLWSVKVKGYSNEKKKKGEFIKDSYLIHAVFDTSGNILIQKRIGQSGGKFPTQGRIARLANGDRVILGTYQSTTGDKGIFSYGIGYDKAIKTYPFTQMLKSTKPLTAEDLTQLYTNYKFLFNQPIVGSDGQLIIGGVFYSPQYNTVSERDLNFNDPYGYGRRGYGYDPYGRSLNRVNSRSRSREVFMGFSYPTGFVAELQPNGELLKQSRIDLNHNSFQIQQPIAFNEKGAVAFCMKGDVATNNFNISTKPILYKLSEDKASSAATQAYLPKYENVTFWYDNYFFAVGSRSKIEAISINDNFAEGVEVKKKKRRQRGKSPASYSQVRKVYYLTKIASGR